ncbi:MAG: hypothetical protein ACJ752_06270 [Gaiellaceae bacterium]
MSLPSFDLNSFTPDEARPTALAVAAWLEPEKFKIKLEETIDGAPYRPTILATNAGLSFLVEAQGTPSFSAGLKEFATWLRAERAYAQLYVAVSTGDETMLSGRMLNELKAHGCGLLLVTGAAVVVAFEAVNPALVITPDPTLKFGHCKIEVQAAVSRFNGGERKAGLRDMCELIERETNVLGRKLARKGWLDKDQRTVDAMDFSATINVIASNQRYTGGRSPLMSDKLKTDLHSFRGARNLVDHPVSSKREEIKRERQFPERMMMGPRLISELVPLQRRVR